MTRRNIFIVFLALLLSSCEKEQIEIGRIYTSKNVVQTKLKAYTIFGEITSPEEINTIMEKNGIRFLDVDTIDAAGEIEVKYISDSRVECKYSRDAEIETSTAHEKGGIIYWEKEDTVTLCRFNAYEDFLKYRPLCFEETKINPATGYNYIIKSKPCTYAQKLSNGFHILYLDVFYKFEKREFSAISRGTQRITGVNNRLNEDFLTTLGEKDTIVWQEYYIELE